MYKIVKFNDEQEWLAWRAEGIGASDVPSIMGEGFDTPYELWRQKMGLVEKKTNSAMRDGKKHEGSAVESLENFINADVKFTQQVAMQHKDFPFLRCTLDGLHEPTGVICEVKSIKGASKKAHKLIPKKYYGQVQMQLFISRAPLCYYAEYDIETGEIWVDLVKENKAYQKRMLSKCKAFFNCMKTNKPPTLTQKEKLLLESEQPAPVDWGDLEEQYEKAVEMLKWAETNADLLKDQMVKMAEEKPAVGKKFQLKAVVCDGLVDYEAIKELRGIDLSQFRKSPSRRFQIVKVKE